MAAACCRSEGWQALSWCRQLLSTRIWKCLLRARAECWDMEPGVCP